MKRAMLLMGTLAGLVAAGAAVAQVRETSFRARNLVVPQAGGFALSGRRETVEVTRVDVAVSIRHRVATTTMDISLANRTGSRQEAELVVPVPEGAAVKGFAYEGEAAEPTARLLPREEATRTYESIVARIRDPALLEFVGWNLVRSSVFPVPAGGTQKVRLAYEHVLRRTGDRVDYILPRTESLRYRVPWHVTATISSERPVSAVYSPSHRLEVERRGPKSVTAEVAEVARTDPGPFRLYYLQGGEEVSASLFAYPDPAAGGGYFLLLAGLPAGPPPGQEAMKRDVTLVLDRSGSMRGEKLRQVREAALQVIGGLEDGEAFNVVFYNQTVDRFAARSVLKSDASMRQAERYIESINTLGGTNIHDALLEALRQEPRPGMLPVVLFLTDGLPTVGRTSEVTIRRLAEEGNPHGKRVFTFGVGADVNAPLLQGVARRSRGTATFVLPGQSVEVEVGKVFRQLYGPIVAAPELTAPRRLMDVVPATVPDLFAGEELVVLGRYVGEEPLHFRLRGDYLGRQRTFKFSFDLKEATTENSFVPRLWAGRKIGVLVQAIREAGAGEFPATSPPEITDPRLRELVEEVVRLSTEFGVLTEYTAFLAREGTDLSGPADLLAEAERNFANRALRDRSGWKGVNQSINNAQQMEQTTLNLRNVFLDQKLRAVETTAVQQVNDRAFYRRGGRWLDSRLLGRGRSAEPARVVEFDSEEFRALVRRLARSGRQGCIALRGDVLLVVDGENLLIRNPEGE